MTNGEQGAAATENPPETAPESTEGAPEQQQAITVGSAIVATTTLDAIFTACWATRSADLAATPVYTWAAISPPQINATWAAANNPSTMMVAKFEIRNSGPATSGGATSSVLP